MDQVESPWEHLQLNFLVKEYLTNNNAFCSQSVKKIFNMSM